LHNFALNIHENSPSIEAVITGPALIIYRNARSNGNIINLDHLFNAEETISKHNSSIRVSFDLDLI